MLINNNNNSLQNGSRNYEPYVRIIEHGIYNSFKTVNHDWCIINTKMNYRRGVSIANTMPVTNNTVRYMHLSDFDNLFPWLSEIPITTNWPL